MIIMLAAYAVTRTKRLVKASKLYWCDTALETFPLTRRVLAAP